MNQESLKKERDTYVRRFSLASKRILVHPCLINDPKATAIEASLAWLVAILARHAVPYQIVGGLAAKFHGARRPLVDLDFYADMRAEGFPAALQDIGVHLTWGPQHFQDASWDITFLKIDRQGLRLEIGDSNDAFFLDRGTGRWVRQDIDYAASVAFPVAGLTVWVMPKQALIQYKRLLARPVDLADLADLAAD